MENDQAAKKQFVLPPVLVFASVTFLLRPGTLPLQPEVSLLYSVVLAFPLTPTGSPDLGLPVSVIW